VCFTTLPTNNVVIAPGTMIDTHNPAMCNATNDQRNDFCVIAGASFTIPAGVTLRATGDKPLILISTTGMFEVSGNIDVSSKSGSNVGAGGNVSPDCMGGTAAMMSSGGAGGSFGGLGGAGKAVGGAGGTAPAAATSFPTTLRGGCKGGLGAGSTTGTGGNGGGAVAIIAPLVVVMGQITASGAGGHGGGAGQTGGGGGGSGGMIVIEAPTISMLGGQAALFANGGGGGQGGEGGGAGGDGGESTGPFAIGRGGTSSGHGGDGGNGAKGNGSKDGDPATNMPSGGGGGGGGGGASGFIRAPGAAASMIAPAPE
jgi:hypothetical protein